MANSKAKSPTQEREIPQVEDGDSGFESDHDFCISDDSDEDPTFDILQETQSRLSKISINKSRNVKEVDSESEDGEVSFGVEIPELDEKDGKCLEKVEELIGDGQVEKLKIQQCKVYLRKYGLRLTGNKGTLIERIKEHLEVINGGGEKKYPISSFVLNCQGDACTGDVVMFEQRVYEMFNVASRSATGPPCGTRVVAGRIVKESYGAAKQQHTFTVEVLWSRGEKPLPPLHPLLIKGRNLYRLKTLRQRWADEEERRKVMLEKHSRGFVARCSREARIKERETRKSGSMRRGGIIEVNQNQEKPIHTVSHQGKVNSVALQPQVNPNNGYRHQVDPIQTRVIQQQNIHRHHQLHHHQQTVTGVIPRPVPDHPHRIHHLQKENVPKPQDNTWATCTEPHYNSAHVSKPHELRHRQQPPPPPLSSSNRSMWSPARQRNWGQPRQWCRYYRQGRCHYGENCKYLHQ